MKRGYPWGSWLGSWHGGNSAGGRGWGGTQVAVAWRTSGLPNSVFILRLYCSSVQGTGAISKQNWAGVSVINTIIMPAHIKS